MAVRDRPASEKRRTFCRGRRFHDAIHRVPPPTTTVTVTKSAGDNQQGIAGQALAAPVEVLVQDADGNPVGGVSVSFAPTGGGGTAIPVRATTDSQGKARSQVYLGTGAIQTFTAYTGSATVTFTATVVACKTGFLPGATKVGNPTSVHHLLGRLLLQLYSLPRVWPFPIHHPEAVPRRPHPL